MINFLIGILFAQYLIVLSHYLLFGKRHFDNLTSKIYAFIPFTFVFDFLYFLYLRIFKWKK